MKSNRYFRHDWGARNDPKVLRLVRVKGAAAKAVFWDLVEMLQEANGSMVIQEAIDTILFEDRITDRTIVEYVIYNSGLFIVNEDTVRLSPTRSEGKIYHNFGANHWKWKGGVTPENVKLRNSSEYHIWRTAVFQRDSYTCQMCGNVGGKIEAHHIKPFAKYPELRLDISNGITLCKSCHKKWHKEQGE